MKAATLYRIYKSVIKVISIHAAREGGDAKFDSINVIGNIFQSTPPVKAATLSKCISCPSSSISIHAAREGGDIVLGVAVALGNISIHAAREGGDLIRVAFRDFGNISIHAAREGGDQRMPPVCFMLRLFQSTPPVKAATKTLARTLSH